MNLKKNSVSSYVHFLALKIVTKLNESKFLIDCWHEDHRKIVNIDGQANVVRVFFGSFRRYSVSGAVLVWYTAYTVKYSKVLRGPHTVHTSQWKVPKNSDDICLALYDTLSMYVEKIIRN